MSTLYVGGLHPKVNKTALREKLAPYGELGKINIRKRMDSVFAQVTVLDPSQADRVIADLNGALWEGEERLRVEYSKEGGNAVAPVVVPAREAYEEYVAPEPLKRPREEEREAPRVRPVKPKKPVTKKKKKRLNKKRRAAKKKKRREEALEKAQQTRVQHEGPVVVKATAWDEVLGHKWEERKTESFSLSSIFGAPPAQEEEEAPQEKEKEEEEEEEDKQEEDVREEEEEDEEEQKEAVPKYAPKRNPRPAPSFMRDQPMDEIVREWHDQKTFVKRDAKKQRRMQNKRF